MNIEPIVMPRWGMEMTEGTVREWLVAEGATVAKGDEIVEIETTKITNVYESPAGGHLRRLVAKPGDTVACGTVIAVLADAAVPDAEIDEFLQRASSEPAVTAGEQEASAPTTVAIGDMMIKVLRQGVGDGTPVVLIHGFGSDLGTWMFNQPALAEKGPAIAFDLPGHGGSSKQVARADVPSLAATVGNLASELGFKRLHLVGHSLGGALAIALAQRAPDRIASLSLIAPAGLGPEVNMTFIDRFVAATARRDMRAALECLVQDPQNVSRRMVEASLEYKRTDGAAAALAEYVRGCFALGRQSWQIDGDLPRTPMCVVWGEDDAIIPASHARRLAGHATTHLLPGTGHLAHMERANEVNRVIAAHIASNP